MPPKSKYNAEVILAAAFELVREEGFEELNARNIAKRLQSSIQPIFSYFENMNQLTEALYQEVDRYHTDYFDQMPTDDQAVLNGAILYVKFALEEPNLFKMLFMTDGYQGSALKSVVDDATQANLSGEHLAAVGLNSPQAMEILTDMWLYAHGIASMISTNHLSSSMDDLEEMLRKMYLRMTK